MNPNYMYVRVRVHILINAYLYPLTTNHLQFAHQLRRQLIAQNPTHHKHRTAHTCIDITHTPESKHKHFMSYICTIYEQM